MTYDDDDCTIGLALLILVIIVTGIILAVGYNAYTVATTTPSSMIITTYEVSDIFQGYNDTEEIRYQENTTNISTNNTMNLSTNLRFAEPINISERFTSFVKFNKSYIVNITETSEHLIIELRR